MDSQEEQKQKVEKAEEGSAAYPAYTVDDLMPRLKEVANHYGVGGQPATRKDICTLLKKAEPTLVYFFSACLQYNLLMSVGKGLVVTELFEKIDKPVFGEQSKRAAKMEAMGNAPLYRRLIEAFNNKTLPNEEGLSNLLKSKEYQVHSNTATKAAKIFYENGRSVNIIDSSNRLTFIIPKESGGKQEEKPDTSGDSEEDAIKDDKDLVKIVIPFGKSGDGKKAYVLLPKDYTNKDLKKIGKFLTALEDEED